MSNFGLFFPKDHPEKNGLRNKKARREVTQLLDEKELLDEQQLMKEQKRLNEKNYQTKRGNETRSPRPLEACLLGVTFSRCS